MNDWIEVSDPDELVLLPVSESEDEFSLPPHGMIGACPKCGYDKVRIEYHGGGYLGEPCGKKYGWPKVMKIGEHLCRTCGMCRFGWPEAVNANI